jgi:hypothetical protein
VVALVVGMCAMVGAVGASQVGAGAAGVAALETNAAPCVDPVVHDRYGGFHVGVPAGCTCRAQAG